MKMLFLAHVIMFMFFSARSQSLIRYQDAKGNRLEQRQVDSMLAAKNAKLKDLGMTARVELLDKSQNGDTLLYNYRLNITTAGVDANDLKKEKHLHQDLPPFNFKTIAGRDIDSRSLLGKRVIINMWFTTCKPCIAEMPQLNQIKKKYRDTNTVFLAMTYETKASVLSFLKKKRFDFDIIAGAKEYCDLFTDNYPITIFVSSEGIVQAIQNGMPFKYDAATKTHTSEVDSSEFEKELAALK